MWLAQGYPECFSKDMNLVLIGPSPSLCHIRQVLIWVLIRPCYKHTVGQVQTNVLLQTSVKEEAQLLQFPFHSWKPSCVLMTHCKGHMLMKDWLNGDIPHGKNSNQAILTGCTQASWSCISHILLIEQYKGKGNFTSQSSWNTRNSSSVFFKVTKFKPVLSANSGARTQYNVSRYTAEQLEVRHQGSPWLYNNIRLPLEGVQQKGQRSQKSKKKRGNVFGLENPIFPELFSKKSKSPHRNNYDVKSNLSSNSWSAGLRVG